MSISTAQARRRCLAGFALFRSSFPGAQPLVSVMNQISFFRSELYFFPEHFEVWTFPLLDRCQVSDTFLSLCKTSALSAQSYNVGKRGKKYCSMMAHFFIKKCGEDPADIIQRGPGMISRRFCRNFGEVFSKRFSRDLVLVLVGKSCGDLGRVLSERSLRKIWLLPCSRGVCTTVVLRCSYSFLYQIVSTVWVFPVYPRLVTPTAPSTQVSHENEFLRAG